MNRIAIQGVRGSYSEEAARKICGDGVELVECADFAAVFAALQSRTAGGAVVPLENKIVGEIKTAAALFRESGRRVLAELQLPIRHVLCGTPGADFENLAAVRSHPEALRQCRRFFADNPQLAEIAGDDTAGSVRQIMTDADAAVAAIAGRRAAEIYGARVLREDIADDADNWTKFYLISEG